MTATEIEGIWTVVSAHGVDLSGYPGLTFQFDKGTLYGNSPCRSFNSDYRVEGDKVRITRPEVFGALCSETVMDAEEAFLRLLRDTEWAEIDASGDLVMISFGDEMMRAKRT